MRPARDPSPEWRRTAGPDETGQIDMTAVMARLDELDRKAARKPQPPKPRRPLSWSAAAVAISVTLALIGGACVALALLLTHGAL